MKCELPSSGAQPTNALDPRAPAVIACLHYDPQLFQELLKAMKPWLFVGHVQCAYVALI